MAKVRTYDLHPIDGRKSFYGKCKVIAYYSDNGITSYELVSYTTIVCSYSVNGFTKLWDGYSATTMRHINAFMAHLGYDYRGKAWWESLPIDETISL